MANKLPSDVVPLTGGVNFVMAKLGQVVKVPFQLLLCHGSGLPEQLSQFTLLHAAIL